MKKVKQIMFVLMLVGTAGIAYAILTLKNMPDLFNWEDEDE